MNKSISAAFVASTLALSLVACGGSSQASSGSASGDSGSAQTQAAATAAAPESTAPQDLVITESAYNVTEGGYVEYVLGIKNPNSDQLADFAVITVTGRKADGSISFSDDWTVGGIAPGSTTYWTSQAGNGNASAEDSIEISVSVDDSKWEKSTADTSNLYAFSNVNLTTSSIGFPEATGEITLNDDTVKVGHQGLKSPMVVCVLRDEAGNLVGGFNGYLMSKELAVGTPTPFDISGHDRNLTWASFEMYANPWM